MLIRSLPFLLDVGEMISDFLAELIRDIAGWIYEPLDDAGLSIDSLMDNVDNARAKGYFTLGRGNLYGVLGAKMFVATRNIFLILIGLVFMFMLLRAALSPSPSKKMEAKSAVTNVALSVFMVAWAPAILNFFFFLRRFFLDTVYSSLGLGDGSSIGDLYVGGRSLMAALMYLAYAIVGVYFAIFYISIAVMQLLMLGVFPIIALQSVTNPAQLQSWFKTFMGWMLIPMVDSVLFLIPIGLASMNAPALVSLVSMFALLPVRKFIFSKLGIEAADVAGQIAAGTTGAMAAAVERGASKAKETVSGAVDDIKQAKSDREEANLQDELAANERGQDGGVSADGTSPTSHGAPSEPGGDSAEASGSSSSAGDAASAERAAMATEGGQINDMGRGEDGADVSAESVGRGAEITADVGTERENGESANEAEGAPIGAAAANADGGAREERPWSPDDTAMRHAGDRDGLGSNDAKAEARDKIAEIYGKHANVNNFEKYKNQLSHEQLAEFYRQRGSVGRTAGKIAGRAGRNLTVGIGEQIGAAGGAMYGAAGAAHGARVGGAVAEPVAMGVGKANEMITRGGFAVGEWAYNKHGQKLARDANLKAIAEGADFGINAVPSDAAVAEGSIIGAPAGNEFAAPSDVAAPEREAFAENPIDTQFAGATEADLDTMVAGAVVDGSDPASRDAMADLYQMYPTSAQQNDAEVAIAEVFASGMQQRDGANISNYDAIAAVIANTPDLGGYYGSEEGHAVPTMAFPTMANPKGAYVGSVSRSMLTSSVRNSSGTPIDFSDQQVSDAAKAQFRSLARTCQGKYVAGTANSGAYFRGLSAQEVNKHAEAIRILNGGASGQAAGAFERLDAMRAQSTAANGGAPVTYSWARPKTVVKGGKTVTQNVGRRMNGLTGSVATTAGSSEPVYARPYTPPVPTPVTRTVTVQQSVVGSDSLSASLMAQEAQMDQAVANSNAVAAATSYERPDMGNIDSLNYSQEELIRGGQIEAQRTFQSQYVNDVMNRPATPDQMQRAQGVDNLLRNADLGNGTKTGGGNDGSDPVDGI